METAPGPAPWYLEGRTLELRSAHGPLNWVDYGADGKTALRNTPGEDLLVLDYYCHALTLDAPRLLVWHERNLTPAAVIPTGVVDFRIFDVDKLVPVPEVPDSAKRSDRGADRVVAGAGEVCVAEIPAHLGEGRHELDLPDAFKALGELILLFHGTELAQMNLCLMEMHPGEGWLQICPQDWFNQGDYDFGYQWPTRVARDPVSGQIFGEGMRLDGFVLDQSNRRVERWVAP